MDIQTRYLAPDQEFLPEGVYRTLWFSEKVWRNDKQDPMESTFDDQPMPPHIAGMEPNIISSLCSDGLHRPILDIDREQQEVHDRIRQAFGHTTRIMWVKSATNWHAYLPFQAYESWHLFMDTLLSAGADPQWVHSCDRLNQALLRAPWSPKPQTP